MCVPSPATVSHQPVREMCEIKVNVRNCKARTATGRNRLQSAIGESKSLGSKGKYVCMCDGVCVCACVYEAVTVSLVMGGKSNALCVCMAAAHLPTPPAPPPPPTGPRPQNLKGQDMALIFFRYC